MAMKYLHIISFDWLEDSLMKKRPLRAGEYLMERLMKARYDKKKQKRENIKEGSKSSPIPSP